VTSTHIDKNKHWLNEETHGTGPSASYVKRFLRALPDPKLMTINVTRPRAAVAVRVER
jgi:hypothetical protein